MKKILFLLGGCIITLILVIAISTREKFSVSKPQTTPDDYLNSYNTLTLPTITTNIPIVNPDNLPEILTNYYSGTTIPIRNRIYVMDISDFFNSKAYASFSSIVKRWPSVVSQQTDKGIIYVKAPYPQGREQIIPFQHNRIIVMDTNTENNDSYTFECLNKAQSAFIRNLLIQDGAVLNTVQAQQNKQLWAQKEQALALEELANYNHGYNTGYALGLANSCITNPSGSGDSSSSSAFDLFSSITGYTGDGASFIGFADALLAAK